MAPSDPTRRRFLGMLGGLVAVAATGGIAALRRPSPTPTSRPPSTTMPMPAPSVPSSTVIAAVEATATTAASPTITAPATRTIDVVCRQAWGAAAARDGMRPHSPERLTLHHTAAVLADNADAPSRARSHQASHQREGFADLAYHFIVDAGGNVLEGRSLEFAGETFTDYDPDGHFLVCCEGNFDEQAPTEAQLASVADLFAWAAQRFGIDPVTLGGHRDYAATACPGSRLASLLADGSLKAMVEDRLAFELVRRDICGEEGTAAVEAIETGQA
jgi:hypothetical protein